jgi:SnoaL-like domain
LWKDVLVHPFRTAVEAGDIDAAVALLADDVVFRSPVVYKPYEGRPAVELILRTVFRVFEDFRYETEIGGEEASDHALVFRARVGDREVHGADFIHRRPDGLIDDFTVMVRPMSGMHALAEAMRAQLESAASAAP